MLIEFRFKNFKSYKDEQVLSLVSTGKKDTSLPGNLIEAELLEGDLTLVSAAAIYGPNASGKSNIIDAIKFIELMVAHRGPSARSRKKNGLGRKPFLFDRTTKDLPTEFELTFIQNNIRYQYGFTLDDDKILGEWLLAYPKGTGQLIFERTIKSNTLDDPEYTWKFQRNTQRKNRIEFSQRTRSDILFLPIAAEFNDQELKLVHDWFLDKLNYTDTKNLEQVYTLSELEANPEQTIKIARLLRESDLGIVGVRLEETEFNPIRIQHFSDEEDYIPELSLEDESLGTQHIFELGGLILTILENGYILFVDELDSSLHPLLAERIVRLFGDKTVNKYGAQLIFNMHNTNLLSSTDEPVLRRDQIWFVEKNHNSISQLYSLARFKPAPRKNEAFEDNYLEGRYGAIPLIGELVESK